MKIVIFANGANPKIKDMQKIITEADYIIAADGGIFSCLDNNCEPDCIIGDLDSFKKNELLIGEKTEIIHISEQNSTDMEKALEHAKTFKPDVVDIFCAFGKRIDHSLGNIIILNNYVDLNINMHDSYGIMSAINPGENEFNNLKGATLSIFAFSKVENIALSGFEFPLTNQNIGPAFIGVSNKIIENKAAIKFDKGRLIVYRLTNESNK